jgi:outer membrane receptor protein involved in Fe transport
MKRNHAVRSAVQRALCVGAVATAAGYAPAAMAQDTDDALEEITVTGTRIARQDYSSASPISTVEAELFSNTGAPTIETVLNTLPQFVPSITSTSNNPSNGGQANVALRGLEAKRTLVLLDGRRIVPSNPTGVVDLNLIPASIIESVEVITGGASAVYGSDAIAGVVNIKTRQFVGLEVTGGYGETGESDGQRTSLGITGGLESSDGRGYAWGSFNWADRDGVLQGDREFSNVAVDWDGDSFEPLGSSTIRQGRWDALTSNLPSQAALDTYFASVPGYVPGDAAPGHNYGFNPDGSFFDVKPVINFTGDANEPLQPVNPASYTYNYAPPNYLELPLERKSFFGRAGFEISDNTEAYAQAMWADYSADQALASTPATGIYVSPTNPNLGAAEQALLASRPDPTAPFRYRKRMLESGPRTTIFSNEVVQFVGGLKGDLPFAPSWSWDAYGSWGSMEAVGSQLGNVSKSAFEELSLAADHGASLCGAPINVVGINSIQPECAAYFTRSANNVESVKQTVAEAFTTGPMFQMPAGDAMAAVGFMYKDDDYKFLPDPVLTATSADPVTGSTRVDISGFNAQQPVVGRTISREAYLEASFPLLGDMTAIQALDFTVGYRYADHSVVGDMSSYKAEGTWDINDAFTIRGGYQRAVRAPNISELFRPATINFPGVGLGDPCSNDFNDPEGFVQGAQDDAGARALCVAQGIPDAAVDSFSFTNTQFQGLSGGNPNLQEETADTLTIGAVFRGDGDGFFGGFSASVDWYQIEIEDTISAIDADVFVERCFDTRFNPTFDNSNQFCQLFERDLGTSTIVNALEVDTNIAQNELNGIDLQIDWSQEVGPGEMRAKWISTYLLSWKEAITSADPLVEFAGTASDDFDALPEWKWTTTLGYAIGGFDADVRWRYIDEMTDTSFPDFTLDAVNYFDVTAGYDFEGMIDGLRIRGGVTNITDEEPIVFPTYQQSNTDPATYVVLGQRWFVNLTYTFQ